MLRRPCSAPRRWASGGSGAGGSSPGGRRTVAMGIDFGTSSTLAALASPSSLSATVVQWPDGSRAQSSVVYYPREGQPIVGNDAAAMLHLHPHQTVAAVKRLIGRTTAEMRGMLRTLPYRVRDTATKRLMLELDGVRIDPVDTAAELIRSARQAAEATVRGEMLAVGEQGAEEQVQFSAVALTVPAQWGEAQRSATLEAASRAGLGDGVTLLSEPVAAALSMGLASPDAAPMVVIDLGGGTMDVTVLRAPATQDTSGHASLLVASHAGDAWRGGVDFTASVRSVLEDKWRVQLGIALDDLNVAAEAEAEAEAVKVRLSSESSTEASLRGVSVPISRSEIDTHAWPHVEHLLDLCREALKEARLRIKDVRTLLLVGGQSRAPVIRHAVRRLFQREPTCPEAPHEAVARGAAVHAALRARGGALLVRDATAFALGLEAVGGAFLPVLPRGSPLPSVADVAVTTALDGQGFMRVRVFQGNAPVAADNKLLGSETLFPLAYARAGSARLKVRFALDAQGFLEVTATDPVSNAVARVAAHAPPALTEEDMLRLLREAEAAKRAKAEQEASAKVRSEAEAVVKYVEESLAHLSDRMPPDEAVELFGHVATTRKALDAGRSAAEVDAALNALRNQLRSALQRRRLDVAL